MGDCRIGVIGMAVMGQNLALNIESKGFPVAVYNRTGEKTKKFFEARCGGKKVTPAYSIEEFAAALARPRRVMIMVKAGQPVDEMIEQLLPHLEEGDIIIDGGNSFYRDTERRNEYLSGKGILFIGTGVSGGEEGALNGPSIMPGGQPKAYKAVAEILEKIAAQVDGPCCTYIGPGGAGHFVKMVHNGIEYGDMQLIAEAYDVMSRGLGMSAGEIADVIAEWNEGDLGSYLMEITIACLRKADDLGEGALVDQILDTAKQKGTGKWTTQSALDIGAPTPTINAAVTSRIISGYRDERLQAEQRLRGPKRSFRGDRDKFLKMLHDALLASKMTSYAQGMALLQVASAEHDYKLNLSEVARIWKGGCVIRAKLLWDIQPVFKRKRALPNLYLNRGFGARVKRLQANWRRAVAKVVSLGIPYMATSASLAYYDAYRSGRLPANITQAQRDYFGAHTYERLDREGSFHTQWEENDSGAGRIG